MQWIKVDKIGNLEEETILLVCGNELVLFVCTDEEKNKYLVETIDSFEGNFVIAQIEDNVLDEMIDNKITMYNAFKRSKKLFYTSFDEDYNLKSEVYSSDKIPDKFLPKKDAFLFGSTT